MGQNAIVWLVLFTKHLWKCTPIQISDSVLTYLIRVLKCDLSGMLNIAIAILKCPNSILGMQS